MELKGLVVRNDGVVHRLLLERERVGVGVELDCFSGTVDGGTLDGHVALLGSRGEGQQQSGEEDEREIAQHYVYNIKFKFIYSNEALRRILLMLFFISIYWEIFCRMGEISYFCIFETITYLLTSNQI